MGRRREKVLHFFGVPILQCRSSYLQDLPSKMPSCLRLRRDPYTINSDRDVLGSGTVQTTGQTNGSHEEILRHCKEDFENS